MTITETPPRTERSTATAPPPPENRRARYSARLIFAVALGMSGLAVGAAAVALVGDPAADPARSEWTSTDGLHWEHPDGRTIVVATPNTVVRPEGGA